MPVYSVKNGSNVTVTDNYGNPTVSIVATPIFAGVNVGGALTGATTGAFSGTVTAAALTASGTLTINTSGLTGITAIAAAGKAAALTVDYGGGGATYLDGVVTYFRTLAGTQYGAVTTAGFTAGSSTYGPTSAFVNGAITSNTGISVSSGITPVIYATSTFTGGASMGFGAGNNNLAPHSIFFYDVANSVAIATLGDNTTAGNFTLLKSGAAFVTASSSYGPTLAVINGSAQVGAAFTSLYYTNNITVGTSGSANTGGFCWANAAGGSGYGMLGATGANGVSGVTDSFLGLIQRGFAALAAMNTSGDLGVLGSFKTGSSVYGSTTAFVNGAVLQVGATGTTTADCGLYIGNNQGGSNQAFVVSHDASTVAGISGNCLAFGQNGLINAMNMDLSGNLGIAGSFYAVSSSKHKTGIREIDFDPIDVIKNTTVKHFNYKTDEAGHEERLGLIADESPVEISGPNQDRHDFMRTIAVLIAANKALISRVEQLEASRA